ncbi:MAG: LPS export ABC transporter periplasmic protein LptC [Burkholderiales bacterium]|nr:LPS export ABC transporter periplasmic protein LptC [Burkholderiales bacterium]
MLKEKVTSIIAIILLATLVGVSYWYSVKAEMEGMGHLSDLESPEFVTHNTTVTKFDENGVAKAKVFAKYAEHFSDGHANATFPEYWSLTPGEGQISATADRGEMTKGGEVIHFYGNVDLRQAAYGDNPASRIQTDQLDAFPDTDTYTTDHHVTLTRGDDVSEGIGADFDKVEHTFKLRSRVATSLQPRDRNVSNEKKPAEKKETAPTPKVESQAKAQQVANPAPAAQSETTATSTETPKKPESEAKPKTEVKEKSEAPKETAERKNSETKK